MMRSAVADGEAGDEAGARAPTRCHMAWHGTGMAWHGRAHGRCGRVRMPLQCARPSAMLPACRALWHYLLHYRLHALRHAAGRQSLLALEANRRFTPPLMRRRGQPWRTRVVAAPVGAGEYSLGPLQLTHSLAHPREGDSSHTAAGGRAEGGGRRPIGRGHRSSPVGRTARHCAAAAASAVQ